MKKWFIRILKSRVVSESVKFRGQIRSRSLRFSFAAEIRIPAPEGILPFFVEDLVWYLQQKFGAEAATANELSQGLFGQRDAFGIVA